MLAGLRTLAGRGLKLAPEESFSVQSDYRACYEIMLGQGLSLVRFNVPLNTKTIGHFGDESSQAINYTGTDNTKITN